MPKGRFTHGCYSQNPRLYSIWKGMIARCINPSTNDYELYGGSGIRVCDDWESVSGFFEWALTNGYGEGLTIDRIDSLKDYEPENCRWATQSQQARNRKSNKVITFMGKTMTMIEWAEFTKIPYQTLKARFKIKWDAERALTEPYQHKYRKPRSGK